MTLRWHVGEVERRGLTWEDLPDGKRAIRASLIAAGYGFESLIPIAQRLRKIGHRVVEESVPRFGAYVFLRFDREGDDWGRLLHHDDKTVRFRRILCNAEGSPSPVPDHAMDAVRAYRPAPPVVDPYNHRYQPGEPLVCLIAGMRKEAVFVEYCGNRPMVRTWIFGAERVTEVSNAEIEPLDIAAEDAAQAL